MEEQANCKLGNSLYTKKLNDLPNNPQTLDGAD